jgi:hypothetical protein
MEMVDSAAQHLDGDEHPLPLSAFVLSTMNPEIHGEKRCGDPLVLLPARACT